ncbi:MAG: tetratricopeptide repeat protein, partial [Chloroflexota bacterium]
MAELGVNPSPETDALYDDIESGKHDPGTQSPNLLASQSPNPPTNLRASLPSPFQLLPQLDYFVGRESEADTLRQWLTQPNGPHFAALVGMGGIGKTTLANQIAHSLRTEFTDGVLWADAVAGEPFDILEGWGKAYGFDFSGLNDVENRAAAVRGMLADKQALIVIDDIFELSRIRPLLPNGEACAVLLTTRNLEIAVSLNAKVIQLETLSAENGRDLLGNIIGSQRVAGESEAADDIGSLLEYHPLALEICAQRLKSRRRRKLVDMAAQLRDVQNRLDLEISDRAVRTSFEVSWEGLDVRQQGVFSKLAVFESRPFASDAVAEITGQNRYKAEDTLDALHALSLVREEGDIHYRLHALLADFALEKLGTALGEVNGRMASYYQTYGQTNQINYDALSLEWPNISAGMRVAHKQENWPLVLTYGETMVEPWFAQARFADIQTGMAWVKEAAEATDDEATLAYFEMKWGQASIERNEYETAVLHLENSFERFQQLDNPARLAEIQFNLARVAIEQNEYEHALDLLMESKQIRQNLSDQKGVAAILYREARVWNAFGPDLNRAEQLAQEALVIQTELQDSYWQINSLRLLTEIEITRKNPEKGLHYSEQALEINTRLQNKGEQAAILYNLSSVYRQMAQFDKAIEVANESLEIFKQMGNLRFQGFLHYSMAMIYQNQNIFDNALLACKECINIFKALGDHTSTVYGLVLWGDCYQAIGQQATAVSKWEQAKEIAIGLTNATFVKMITSRLASVSTD